MTTPKEGAGLLDRLAGGIDDALAARRELNALAPDHALLLRALTLGVAELVRQVDPYRQLVAVDDGSFHEVDEDAAGIPALTPELRSALRKVVGSNG